MDRGISDTQSVSYETVDSTESHGIADFAGSETTESHLDLKVMSVEYTDSKNGTIVHVFGRDSDGKRHHIEVDEHYPSFYIREEAHNQRIDNHYAVHKTEKKDPITGESYQSLHEEPLVRVYTYQPGQVGTMRDLFGEHWEADVLYNKRWLIDTEVYTGMRIDLDEAQSNEPWIRGDYRVPNGAVEPLSRDATPGVQPKQVVLDIEVAGEEGVPDADRAEYPVSTIVAWDTDSEQYVGWLLLADGHDSDQILGNCQSVDHLMTFEDESEMLYDFNEWMRDQRPDIITGWYSNDFDLPYLVNRSRSLTTHNYQDWSPLGEVFISKYEPVVKGVNCVDMLGAYKKTQIHKLKQKGLDDIAEKELGKSKEEIDMSHTEMWKQRPVEFLRYNKVDVELVHEIDEASGAIDLLDNLRAVVGCSYTDPIGGNIDMMDMLFLRKAKEYGYALPTAQKPDVGDYHGAFVYTPEPGLHQDVIYPDYSSLYPNMMYQCNISPETLVGTAEDLEASEYDEDDCVWTYIDTATPPPLKEGVEANKAKMEKLYFIKPSKEEGFIRSVLDDVMGLADQYTGGMYEAVKRVRNSTYGVMGDSDSYGSGFRLFDWRLAEGTTLGGQRVLKDGAEYFLDAVNQYAEPGKQEAKIVGGDTDSFMTAIRFADSGDEALEIAEDAARETNSWLNTYAADEFGLEGPEDARMELEIESYASALFFKGDDGGRSDEGVKKRYVQKIEWDDDNGWLEEPGIGIKGFEYVRSDISNVTADVQYFTFEKLMDDGTDAEAQVKEYVTRVITEIIEGDYDMDDVAIPFGISQDLHLYGQDGRGMPWYHGAKYANEYIYGGEAIAPGGDPFYFYIQEGKTGEGLPSTYRADDAAKGDYVDCIAVQDPGDVPEEMRIDRPKMVEKTIIKPMEGIFRTLGWGTEWMQDAVDNATPPEYYRDANQLGFEDVM